MKILFIILIISTVSLFAIATAVFFRFRRHKQQISDTMLRKDFARIHTGEDQTLSETIGASR